MLVRKAIVVLLAVATLAGWLAAPAFTQSPNNVSGFMRLKLAHSQQILEGLALENFETIAKHSQELSLLTQDESWMVLQTLEYRQHSSDFQRIADSLTKAAKDRNLDGAALAYMQLTMSCVNCHKYTRGVAMVALPEPASDAAQR